MCEFKLNLYFRASSSPSSERVNSASSSSSVTFPESESGCCLAEVTLMTSWCHHLPCSAVLLRGLWGLTVYTAADWTCITKSHFVSLEWLGCVMEGSGENWAHAVSYPGCTNAGSRLNLHFSPSPCCATAITFFSLSPSILVYIICTMNHLDTRKEWEIAYESWSLKYSASCYRLI